MQKDRRSLSRCTLRIIIQHQTIIILRRLRHQILRRIPVLLHLLRICQLVIILAVSVIHIIIAVHDLVIRQNRSRICLQAKCHRKAVHARRSFLIALLLLRRDAVHAADCFFRHHLHQFSIRIALIPVQTALRRILAVANHDYQLRCILRRLQCIYIPVVACRKRRPCRFLRCHRSRRSCRTHQHACCQYYHCFPLHSQFHLIYLLLFYVSEFYSKIGCFYLPHTLSFPATFQSSRLQHRLSKNMMKQRNHAPHQHDSTDRSNADSHRFSRKQKSHNQ